MSVKTLLYNIINEITHFIEKLLPSTKHLLDHAIDVVTLINKFVQSAGADVLTAIIPTKADDWLKDKLRIVLPEVMIDLRLVIDHINKTPDEIVLEGIQAIQSMSHNAKSVTLQSLFQLIGNALTDDAVRLSDLQKIGQALYEHSKSE